MGMMGKMSKQGKLGKLIVFEGIDGSGKSTQLQLLCDRLSSDDREFERLVFPRYSEPSSALIRMYLAGQFGQSPSDVNPYAASTFYAVDRFASYKTKWETYYRKGGLLLSDRYTTSNAIHQGSKLAPEEREEFFRWLYDFEFRLMELPKPDLVIYMDVPLQTSLIQLQKRQAATGTMGDIHETDTAYLAACRECGLHAAEFYGWKKIQCFADGAMRPAGDISEEIYRYLAEVI